MKKMIVLFLLRPTLCFAFHGWVKLTPKTMKKSNFNISIEVIEQTEKEGKKPIKVTGHLYRVSIKSKKINLTKCDLSILIKDSKSSYLHVQPKCFFKENDYLLCDINFSSDYLDKTYMHIRTLKPFASFTYIIKIKDFIKESKPNK
ncbi:MAG: hypothetical protein COA79_21080 [Planctomycetota bacterium]|nr:MAG: hypothetical protein COA79_21080 [Planctomycetota bacterium]